MYSLLWSVESVHANPKLQAKTQSSCHCVKLMGLPIHLTMVSIYNLYIRVYMYIRVYNLLSIYSSNSQYNCYFCVHIFLHFSIDYIRFSFNFVSLILFILIYFWFYLYIFVYTFNKRSAFFKSVDFFISFISTDIIF